MNIIWRPEIEIEGVHGTREVSLSTHLLTERKIFLVGEIDSDMASSFVAQLLCLQADSLEPVTVYINSPGGEVNAGLLIYDAIQGARVDINLICTGLAASMAAVILCGGQRGHRFILPHSKIMIHEPLLSSGLGGSATSIRHISESIIETRDILSEILAKHTDKNIDEINKAISYDNYMKSTEAISFGICDEIITQL